MYYICKFSGTWLVYDAGSHLSKVLPPPQVETVRELFPAAIKEAAVLDALIVAPISASKLQQTAVAAYFICKFAGTWSLYDGYNKASRILKAEQIEALKELFPGAYKEGAVLDALIITAISASKLQGLTLSVSPPAPVKKAT
jgi:hypothetical protein